VWNLGEENTNTIGQVKAFATYFKTTDPYQHPVVVHNNDPTPLYPPLMGFQNIDGPSMQFHMDHHHDRTIHYIEASAAAGNPWFVASDEQNPWQTGVVPDSVDPTHDIPRKNVLWGNLMAGGSGAEWYFGYEYPDHDLTMENWRTRETMWDQTRYALDFFAGLPFWKMRHADRLTHAGDDYVFADVGNIYVVYTPDGGPITLEVPVDSANYTVQWYDPRAGVFSGEPELIRTGSFLTLNPHPEQPDLDWAVLVRRLQP
jgi:hypothetical protein